MIKNYRNVVVANPRRILRLRVRNIIRAFSGRVGVSARNLTTSEKFNINEQTVFPALSSIKLAILIELFYQEKEGKLQLDEKITITRSDQRGGTGILRDLTPPIHLSLRDLAVLMITVSDNTSTWLVSSKVGRSNVNDRMRLLGLKAMDLRSDLGPAIFERMDHTDIDAYAVSSPADMTDLIGLIAEGKVVSRRACTQMIEILRMCQSVDFLGRYLPINQFATETKIEPEAKLANKIGSMMHGRTDVGLVETESVRYVITVMTDRSLDNSLIMSVHEGTEVIGRISKAVYDAWALSPLSQNKKQGGLLCDDIGVLEQWRLDILHRKRILQEEREFHDH
ncbi:uncharacterized protein METZ01_LOCUS114080 [marine metagenome]|uniref:Beta-lactamase class A catalytic domain-containing protein n=1 Tax=marine metagenome TaxID=408172 RepID=A0A381X8Z7_9ZZZZ